MAHILFADANESSLRTMARAQALGHRTSIIRSASMQMYGMTRWVRAALDGAARDVMLPLTSDAALMQASCRRDMWS